MQSSSSSTKVSKPRSQLSDEEKGPFGCAVCKEDQTQITLNNGTIIKICKNIASKIKKVLNNASDGDFEIVSLTGYRVSKSRGPLDSKGNRTLFSNHAYGVAVDVNEAYNGLYRNCQNWNKHCRLVKGGYYNPQAPKSITENSKIYIEMKKAGFEWGGHRKDSLKDFMHFSPDGT